MKIVFTFLFLVFISVSAFAQEKSTKPIHQPDSTKKILTVEAACGECQFKLPGKGCDLAVRIDGKSYFVDGTSIDEHGDAHDEDGFCNAISKANVQGEVVDGRFKATYFKVVKVKSQK